MEVKQHQRGNPPSRFPTQHRSVSWLTEWNSAAQKQEASDPPHFNLLTNVGSRRLKRCIVWVSNDGLTPHTLQMAHLWWTGFPEFRLQNNGTFRFRRQTTPGRCQWASEWRFSGETTWTGHPDRWPSRWQVTSQPPLQFTVNWRGSLCWRSRVSPAAIPLWTLWKAAIGVWLC